MEFLPLGTSAASPGYNRHLAGYIIKDGKKIILFDCGEGTQFQLAKYHISLLKITKIFISHLHGDHFYGLFPLISTMSLNGRKKPLNIYSPPGLKSMFEAVVNLSHQTFEVNFIETKPDSVEVLIDEFNYKISYFPLLHSLPTNGYIYTQKEGRPNISKKAINEFGLSVEEIKKLISGKNIRKDEKEIFSKDVTYIKHQPKSFAYCSDTGYFNELSGYLKGVDYLFHESTFLKSENELAILRQHSTACDAAKVAKQAGVEKVFLGHFSNRYPDCKWFEEEAKEEFENVECCVEGKVYELK